MEVMEFASRLNVKPTHSVAARSRTFELLMTDDAFARICRQP